MENTKLKATRKKRKNISALDVGILIFFIFMVIIIVFPFYYSLIVSIIPQQDFLNNPLILIPNRLSFESYKYIFSADNIWKAYGNTIFLVIVGTSANILATIPAGYVLSRKKFVLKNFFMNVIIFTMFFSGGFIPWYRMIFSLGLKDTRAVLILPNLVSTFNLLLARNYFQSLPAELEESAMIDGANEIIILFKIFLPIAMPIVATISLFYAVGHWNAWYNAMLFISKEDLIPLSMLLRNILGTNATAALGKPTGQIFTEGIKMASIYFTIIPIMLVYPFIQRYFVKGIMVGAIKG